LVTYVLALIYDDLTLYRFPTLYRWNEVDYAGDDDMERTSSSVDEEYERAFKSRSFLDLWSKNAQLQHTTTFFFDNKGSSSSSCHDEEQDLVGQPCSYTVLDDFVLEPSPEALSSRKRRRRRLDSLLMEYFELTQEACSACSELLTAIGAARQHHLTLRRLLSAAARDALAEHVRLDNPLSPARLSVFHGVHGRCAPLATRLGAARVGTTALLAAGAAAVVALAVVGVGASVLRRWASGKARERRAGGEAVDAAARGAYIVGRGMDTLSRMVRRAHDELEHGRRVARIAVDSWSSSELLQEVGREEAECEADLREQLEEMEEHVCLCLITINRSRRMVAHEMTRGMPPPSAK
jgi:hypothetical protein